MQLPARPHHKSLGNVGFTTIELLVVLAIVGILATLALPGFHDLIDRYRVRQATEDLTATIYLARTEAIKRGGEVILRKATLADCAGSTDAARWECGWFIFVDGNNNNLLESDELLVQTSPAAPGVRILFTSKHAAMPVDRWGQFNGSGAFGFIVQSARNGSTANPVALCMTSGGRLATKIGATACQS